jgi:hypothetical protein
MLMPIYNVDEPKIIVRVPIDHFSAPRRLDEARV